MDKSLYVEKAALLLDNNKFEQLNEDPTNKLEGQVQRALREIKDDIGETDYWKLYPRGSKPAQFYGTAKVHKITDNETVSALPLRPIVSNIGSATYKVSKYLASLLSPLATSEYTISNTKHFVDQLRNIAIDHNQQMISLAVATFTNVPQTESTPEKS